jgi:hypothetical protein
MRGTWHKTSLALAAAAGLALAAGGSPAAGQSKKGNSKKGAASSSSAKQAPAPRAAKREPRAPGLAGLSDDALLAELAARQMPALLEHAFEANNVPEQQRLAMMALPAIARLGDKSADLKPHERVALINQIAAGAEKVVASIDDPRVLMEHSATLIKEGVEPEVNVMEYWGETAKSQARLRPVIGAVIKMLNKAVETGSEIRAKAEQELENDGNNKRTVDAWTKADELVNTAEFTRAMVRYNEAMALPSTAKGLEERKKIAAKALEFLEVYDNAESGIQAAIRNRMAKLLMVQKEYGAANDLFETVVSGAVNETTKIDPPPTPFEQYEARYFSVVAELMQGDVERAKKGLDEIIAWQVENVKDEQAAKQVAAAAEMLRYRILMKERDKLKDPAGKKAAEDKAMAVLMELNEKQPELRPIIAEQLIAAMGDKVDVKAANLLILNALVDRAGQAAAGIEDPAQPDPTLARQVEQGIEGATELMTRKDPAIKEDTVKRMASRIPLFYEKLGRRIEAAQAYLDFIEQKRGEGKLIEIAFNQAGFLLSKVLADPKAREDPAFTAAWERFLPIAINQFKRNELAFEFANRLRAKGQLAEAVKNFGLVPANHKSYLEARFRRVVAQSDMIYAVGPDKKPLVSGAEKEKLVAETQAGGEEVSKLMTAAAAKAADPAEKQRLLTRAVIIVLMQAELEAGKDKPDWNRVLKVLEGFENRTKGLDNEQPLNKKVMELRVASLMQLKQFDKAADVLIELLEKEPGGLAAGLVLGILQKLNEDYDRAIAQGNKEAARDILKDRANLSGFLVKWAANNADPNVKKNLYVYEVYDADTQRLYGQSLEDEAQRKPALQKANDAFQKLRTPAKVDEYKAVVAQRKLDNPEDKTDPDAPDPAVTLGMALVSYDLRDWKTASQELKKLRFGGKLGSRAVQQTDMKTGEVRVVPNEQYWEAMYKYYNSTYEWARSAPQDNDGQAELSAVKTLLRRDYVAGADDVGGIKWREPFEKLRKELIPDLDLESLKRPAVGGTAPAPASQPAKEAEPVATGNAK